MPTIRCRCCGGKAASLSRHDFRVVKNCPNESSVDGGYDYSKYGGLDASLIDVLDRDGNWRPLVPPTEEIGAHTLRQEKQ